MVTYYAVKDEYVKQTDTETIRIEVIAPVTVGKKTSELAVSTVKEDTSMTWVGVILLIILIVIAILYLWYKKSKEKHEKHLSKHMDTKLKGVTQEELDQVKLETEKIDLGLDEIEDDQKPKKPKTMNKKMFSSEPRDEDILDQIEGRDDSDDEILEVASRPPIEDDLDIDQVEGLSKDDYERELGRARKLFLSGKISEKAFFEIKRELDKRK